MLLTIFRQNKKQKDQHNLYLPMLLFLLLHNNNILSNDTPAMILQQFRVIGDHLNSKCLTSIIVFDIEVQSSIQ